MTQTALVYTNCDYSLANTCRAVKRVGTGLMPVVQLNHVYGTTYLAKCVILNLLWSSVKLHEDASVCRGSRRPVSVAYRAPFVNALTYLLINLRTCRSIPGHSGSLRSDH